MSEENAISFAGAHDDIAWDEIITSAKRIDIAVLYYGKWLRKHEESLRHFFTAGGELNLIMSDPVQQKTLEAVHAAFFPERTVEELKTKILETQTILDEIARDTPGKGNVWYLSEPLRFSLILVDDRLLYLSVYEQFKDSGVRSPVFLIDLSKNEELRVYWLSVRDRLIAESRSGA